MKTQNAETTKSITITGEWGDPVLDANGKHAFPDAIKVGAMVKFSTIRDNGMCVRSTGFVVDGDRNQLTIKDYTGKISGTVSI